MQCERIQEQIGAWQDGELNRLAAWRIHRHIQHCTACAAEAEALARLGGALAIAAPFGPEPRHVASYTFPWKPIVAAGSAVALASVMLYIGRGVPSGGVEPAPLQTPLVAVVPEAVPTPSLIPDKALEKRQPEKRIKIKLPEADPAPVRRRVRRRLHRRYSPLPRPSLRSRVLPTPETEGEVIQVAARTPTREELLSKMHKPELIIYVEAKPVLPPGYTDPTYTDGNHTPPVMENTK